MQRVIGLVVVLAIAAGVILGVPSVRVRVLGVELKSNLAAGQTFKMKNTVDGTVTFDLSGVPKPLMANISPQIQQFMSAPITLGLETVDDHKVTDLDVTNHAHVEVTPVSRHLTFELLGKKNSQNLPAPKDQKMTYEIAKDGTVSVSPGKGSDDPTRQMMSMAAQILSGPAFPSGRVRPSQTWDRTINASTQVDNGTVAAHGKVTYRLIGVEDNRASIQSDFTINLDLPAPAIPQTQVDFGGTMTGTGEYTVDVATGLMATGSHNGKLQIMLSMKGPVTGKGGATIDLKSTTQML